jgi:hypothetical protein
MAREYPSSSYMLTVTSAQANALIGFKNIYNI